MDMSAYLALIVTGAIYFIIMGVVNLKKARDE